VWSAGAGERRADLVHERPLCPVRVRHVEELVQLRGGQDVAGGRAEDDSVRPADTFPNLRKAPVRWFTLVRIPGFRANTD